MCDRQIRLTALVQAFTSRVMLRGPGVWERQRRAAGVTVRQKVKIHNQALHTDTHRAKDTVRTRFTCSQHKERNTKLSDHMINLQFYQQKDDFTFLNIPRTFSSFCNIVTLLFAALIRWLSSFNIVSYCRNMYPCFLQFYIYDSCPAATIHTELIKYWCYQLWTIVHNSFL